MIEQAAGLTEISEWARTGLTGGVLAVLLGFWLKKRKDDREGWGVLIQALQTDVATVRQQHQRCEERLTEVEAQLRGVHRQLVLHSSQSAVSLGPPSEDIMDAARRATDAVQRDDESSGGP